MPGLVGTAVNITLVPEQIAPEGFAEMETLTGCNEFTTMVTVFDVAGFPDVHDSLEVNTQVTASLLTGI